MSAESTATTINDVIYGYNIEPSFLDYAHEFTVATPLFRRYSLVGKPSNVLQIPRITADMTVNDNGASTDGEFDATEGTALSNTALDTENVQATCAEYGLQRSITDNVFEDSIMGADFMSMVIMDAARILTTAVETDAVTLFASLSNGVGTTNTNITMAVAVSMLDGIRNRGYHAPDGVAFVWDNQTWGDLRDLLIATGTSWTVYAGAADRFLGAAPEGTNGLASGLVGQFLGMPCWVTGLTPNANGTTDVVSAAFVPSTPANDAHATFAYTEKRPFRVEAIRVPGLRADQVVFTRRCAVSEIADGSGTKHVGDAD